MTGCAVISPERAVVVAEGSAKAQKRYAKLLLQRIDWNEHRDDEEGQPARHALHTCSPCCTCMTCCSRSSCGACWADDSRPLTGKQSMHAAA